MHQGTPGPAGKGAPVARGSADGADDDEIARLLRELAAANKDREAKDKLIACARVLVRRQEDTEA